MYVYVIKYNQNVSDDVLKELSDMKYVLKNKTIYYSE